ncbi:MAG: hypothetical protein ACI4FZ_05130 [Lachnospiraceae bacterium]
MGFTDENSREFLFTKMVIDSVKKYAREHNCSIEEACGAATGVSRKAYDDAIQFMISTGHRYNIYNKVQIVWDSLDVMHNNDVRMKYPALYREIIAHERSDAGDWYSLSDEAYDEWCRYKKEEQ